jgi:hypothetical protein
MTGYSHEIIGQSPDLLKGINSDKKNIKKIISVTLKEESVIEMIAYTKDQEEFWLRFSMIPIYNSENELSLGVYTEMLLKREIRKKEKNI